MPRGCSERIRHDIEHVGPVNQRIEHWPIHTCGERFSQRRISHGKDDEGRPSLRIFNMAATSLFGPDKGVYFVFMISQASSPSLSPSLSYYQGFILFTAKESIIATH
jgi:hypothetical protein